MEIVAVGARSHRRRGVVVCRLVEHEEICRWPLLLAIEAGIPRLIVIALPASEVVLGLLLVGQVLPHIFAWFAVALFTGFLGKVVSMQLATGRAVPCNCFGGDGGIHHQLDHRCSQRRSSGGCFDWCSGSGVPVAVEKRGANELKSSPTLDPIKRTVSFEPDTVTRIRDTPFPAATVADVVGPERVMSLRSPLLATARRVESSSSPSPFDSVVHIAALRELVARCDISSAAGRPSGRVLAVVVTGNGNSAEQPHSLCIERIQRGKGASAMVDASITSATNGAVVGGSLLQFMRDWIFGCRRRCRSRCSRRHCIGLRTCSCVPSYKTSGQCCSWYRRQQHRCPELSGRTRAKIRHLSGLCLRLVD